MADSKQTGVTVRLTGFDGNIFAIMGRVGKALVRAGHQAQRDEMLERIQKSAHSFDEALQIIMEYVEVE